MHFKSVNLTEHFQNDFAAWHQKCPLHKIVFKGNLKESLLTNVSQRFLWRLTQKDLMYVLSLNIWQSPGPRHLIQVYDVNLVKVLKLGKMHSLLASPSFAASSDSSSGALESPLG